MATASERDFNYVAKLVVPSGGFRGTLKKISDWHSERGLRQHLVGASASMIARSKAGASRTSTRQCHSTSSSVARSRLIPAGLHEGVAAPHRFWRGLFVGRHRFGRSDRIGAGAPLPISR
jgi:hypothetical protein